MDVLLILHLDHEQNCSTSTLRAVASSQSDLFCSAAGAMAALYGPLHGGANEEVLHMLKQIGSKDKVADFVKSVKEGKGKIMGFGHRVYKNYDPRARVIKTMADAVFSEVGKNPLIELALELERIALSDEYFITRKLYPNVDFYSGLVYEAFKLPEPMFTVMFAVARASGWAAQYLEIMEDGEQKIARPRQLYLGARERDYVKVDKR
jgi:citrate synthase